MVCTGKNVVSMWPFPWSNLFNMKIQNEIHFMTKETLNSQDLNKHKSHQSVYLAFLQAHRFLSTHTMTTQMQVNTKQFTDGHRIHKYTLTKFVTNIAKQIRFWLICGHYNHALTYCSPKWLTFTAVSVHPFHVVTAYSSLTIETTIATPRRGTHSHGQLNLSHRPSLPTLYARSA